VIEMKDKKIWPVAKSWIPINENNWVNWSLWENNVSFQRRVKTNDEWNTVEKFHFSPKVLKEIWWRIPNWLTAIECKRKKNLVVLS
jgi:hypothetical protein